MTKLTYTTFRHVKAVNIAAGRHFFDADARRFFRSRLHGKPILLPDGRTVFVTSEQFEFQGHFERRKFSVRVQDPSGNVDTLGDFQAYATLADASKAAREFARSQLAQGDGSQPSV